MPRKYFTAEQIISKLREAEMLISQGKTAAEASRAVGISEQTYYRWRKECCMSSEHFCRRANAATALHPHLQQRTNTRQSRQQSRWFRSVRIRIHGTAD